MIKFRPQVFLLFIILLSPVVSHAQGRVRMREYRQVFTTYPYSDPNPVATPGKIYPYFRYERYSDRPVEKEWTVVELENDYIRVLILPEIGGKVWAAIDKGTGRAFIYYNHVVKFRDIAMRGPWTSGGIEANYGIIGHTPNCATPVDYLLRENDDGSVSCHIGVLDLLTRTPWRLEVNLPADKAWFSTRSFWYNATPLEQPYYTWMNAGIKAAGDLQFIYPGTHYLGHGGEASSWPVNTDNGRDISFYEKNDFGSSKSYHVFGKYSEFYGAYWHADDFGMARYSSHDDKPGKKIWIWGLSLQGMIWEKLLTDSDGQYVEVQSGRLFNQAAEQSTRTPFKHRGFGPYTTDRWTEYWFPVRGTKGFVIANLYGALNVRREGRGLALDFSPVQTVNDKLEVFDGERLVYSKALSLKPLEVFHDRIDADVPAERLRVTLGGNKLEYEGHPDAGALSRPVESPSDFDWDSVYGLYLQGVENIRQRHYGEAREKLEACLKKDAHYAPALVDLSLVACREMNYREAFDLARRALSIDTYDPAANYYYGLAALRLGRTTDAKDGFDIAAQSVEFRSAAYVELSRIYFREGKYERALDYAGKAIDFNRYNLEAHQIIAVIHRLRNDRRAGMEALGGILSIDPLNHFARFERSLWEGTEQSRRDFSSLIRNEMPHETYLELAIWYGNLGRFVESDGVLRLAPENPEVLYWRAYLKERTGQPGIDEMIRQANQASPHLVFPFRAETADVLTWVAGRNGSWQPKYYLALIRRGLGDEAGAWKLLSSCGEAPEYAPFYAARAQLGWKSKAGSDPLADAEKSARLDPREWRYGRLLAEYHMTSPQPERALQIAQKYHEQEPDNYQIGALYARTLLLNRQYQACSDLLGRLNLLPYEGSTEGRLLYKEAQLMLALEKMKAGDHAGALKFISAARLWPENLGAGKPYPEMVDERLEDWLESICQEKLGRGAEARATLDRIASFRIRRFDVNSLVSALALRKLGRGEEGAGLLTDATARGRTEPLRDWCVAVYEGKKVSDPGLNDVNFRVVREWAQMKIK